MENRLILRVYENKITKQKLVCIPKKIKEIKAGDFVEVKKRILK